MKNFSLWRLLRRTRALPQREIAKRRVYVEQKRREAFGPLMTEAERDEFERLVEAQRLADGKRV